MADGVSVKVFCRFRPFNQREKELGGDEKGFIKLTQTGIELSDPSSGAAAFNCEFDHIFGMDTQQPDMYDIVGRPTVLDIMDGYNGTIFAYGQTGSGKSFSMMGAESSDHPELAGLIPRATENIFEIIANEVRGVTFSVSVSYLEVYREVIRDLLDPAKSNLRVRESPQKGVYVEGLTTEFVATEEEVLAVLKIGDESRAVASTNMNAVSSRSHSLLIMTVHQSNEEDGSSRAGQLNLVDLAGSEKIGKTGAKGATLEEAKKINQSLSALSNVIKGLADGKGHVPYRDSKLTRILQNSLGGNTKTSLVLAASPHPDNAPETLSTLKFGQRAKTIKTQVKKNEQRSAEELSKILEKMQGEMAQLRGYVSALETKLKEAGLELPSGDEATEAAKAVSQAVVGGAGSARVQEELDKLKDEYRLMREEMGDLKTELADAQAEARQAESRETVVQGHLARFQGLAKQAAGEIKGLRGELDHRTMQRGMAVDRMTSMMIELTEKDAELKHLRAMHGEDGDAAEDASVAEDELVQRMSKCSEDNEETQRHLHEKYGAEVSKLKEQNVDLKEKLSESHDVDAELKQLRWLSDQTDKMVAAERAARTAGQRVVMGESAADQRVAFAQEEAASRVAEAHANIESKLQELKVAGDKRVKQAEDDAEKQLTEANGRVKMGIAKAREVITKQKVAWEGRVAEVETKAAESVAAAKKQGEEQVAEATKTAESKVAEMEAKVADEVATAATAATEREEARVEELVGAADTKLADALREAEEKVTAAKTEAEERLSGVRTEALETLAASKAEAETALRAKEEEAAAALAKATADGNERVAAAEARETESTAAAGQRAQAEVAEVKAESEKQLAEAAAEVEHAKAAAHTTKEEMTKRDEERTAAAADKAVRLEKEKEDAVAAVKVTAASELTAAAEASKAELEKVAADAEDRLRQEKADLEGAAAAVAAAAQAKQTSLEADNKQMSEQLEQVQQAAAAGESGASDMIGSIQTELSAAKTARDELSEQVASLSAAKSSLETSHGEAAAAAKAHADAAETKHIEALEAHTAKVAALEEQAAAKVAEVQKQREEEVAKAETEAKADADSMIEMAQTDVEEAEATIEKQEKHLTEAAERLSETEKKAAEQLAEKDTYWNQRYTESTERIKADQEAHAGEIVKLNADWSAKLSAAVEGGKAGESAAQVRLEEARQEAVRVEAEKVAAMQKKLASSEEAAAQQAQQKMAEIERSAQEKITAAEKQADEKLKAQKAELEASMVKKLTEEREASSAELAEAKARSKKDADAEAESNTTLALEEADERVKAAEAKIKTMQERADRNREAAEGEVGAKEAATQQQFMASVRDMKERQEQETQQQLTEMSDACRVELSNKDQEIAQKQKELEAVEKMLAAAQQAQPMSVMAGGASPGGRIARPAGKVSILDRYRQQNAETGKAELRPDVQQEWLAKKEAGKLAIEEKKKAAAEDYAQKKEAAIAAKQAITAKQYTVEPEGAYMVHPTGNLIPGSLYMSGKNLTFKSQIEGGEINAKVPLADIVAVTAPANYNMPKDAKMYFSLCGGAPMSSFRVVFQQKMSKAAQLATMKKDEGGNSTEVDYIVATERAAALHAALLPYVGKEKVNKSKGKMARFGQKLAYAGVENASIPEKPFVEPQPTPSMIAGGQPPPSSDMRAPPPGWELKDSKAHADRKFYWHAATGQASWTYPGAGLVGMSLHTDSPDSSPSKADAMGLMPWDGQEVTLIKPTDGTGFGINIDAECVVINFNFENSCAEEGGIVIGTRIVRINGKRVKTNKEVAAALKPLGPGDRAEFLMHSKEQASAKTAQLTQQAQQKMALAEEEPAASAAAARTPHQSRYRKADALQRGFSPADALHAAAKEKAGGIDGLLAVSRNKQLAQSQACVKTGFLLKKSGGYFDAAHAEMGTSKKKGKSAGQWKRRFFAITGGADPKIDYYGDQQEFRQRMEPKGSFSLRGAKAELNDAENKGLPVPKAFMIRCDTAFVLDGSKGRKKKDGRGRDIHVKVSEMWEDPLEWVTLLNAISDAAEDLPPPSDKPEPEATSTGGGMMSEGVPPAGPGPSVSAEDDLIALMAQSAGPRSSQTRESSTFAFAGAAAMAPIASEPQASPCSDYRLNMLDAHGACKCGHPKEAH